MYRLLYGFVHYESRFCHFTETCGSYPAHDFYNFHNVCKDRVVYPYFMPILILSVVFGSLRHLLVIISPYSMSTVIYSHYINLSIFRVIVKVKNLGLGVGTKGKPPHLLLVRSTLKIQLISEISFFIFGLSFMYLSMLITSSSLILNFFIISPITQLT